MGQLLATTLPGSRQSLENTILLYDHQNPDGQEGAEDIPTEDAQEYDSHSDVDKQRRAIFLRNMLLDVILSLLTTDTLVLNTQWVVSDERWIRVGNFARGKVFVIFTSFSRVKGFDWWLVALVCFRCLQILPVYWDQSDSSIWRVSSHLRRNWSRWNCTKN